MKTLWNRQKRRWNKKFSEVASVAAASSEMSITRTRWRLHQREARPRCQPKKHLLSSKRDNRSPTHRSLCNLLPTAGLIMITSGRATQRRCNHQTITDRRLYHHQHRLLRRSVMKPSLTCQKSIKNLRPPSLSQRRFKILIFIRHRRRSHKIRSICSNRSVPFRNESSSHQS